jgi:hypothetical protein
VRQSGEEGTELRSALKDMSQDDDDDDDDGGADEGDDTTHSVSASEMSGAALRSLRELRLAGAAFDLPL